MKTSGEDVFGPHHVSFVCDLPEAGRYTISVKAVLGPDQGILRVFERDRPAGEAVNLYAAERDRRRAAAAGDLRDAERREHRLSAPGGFRPAIEGDGIRDRGIDL